MTAAQRLRRLPWRAELVLALGAGAAAFAFVALLLELAGADLLVALVGAGCVVAVVAIERAFGIAYAVPAALAALVAFDWYQFPPTHPFAFPDAANLASLLVYLGAAALVGELAAYAARRAEVSEAARSRLAEDQAALRRVATLVARGVAPAEIVAAVAAEASALLDVDGARVVPNADDVDSTPGAVVERTLAEPGVRSAVGAPIVVDGRPWGVLVAWSRDRPSLPRSAAARLADFTELVATAISNTEARTALAASRARIVAAADDERRQVVRDLHDGAQQRLVHAVVTLKRARLAIDERSDAAAPLVDDALGHAEAAMWELRELAHGILPAALVRGGLRAGVDALASRMPVPVATDVAAQRFPAPVEATAYFVVAEALTNVAKHARAERAAVSARVEHGALRIHVRDDGVGGARTDGSGLVGLADRLAVLDGGLRVESPPRGGTVVAAAIPLRGRACPEADGSEG